MDSTRLTSRRVLNVIDRVGYIPVTFDANLLLYTSVKSALEANIDRPSSFGFIDHLCSVSGLTEKELLTNKDLFEKSLNITFDGNKKAVDVVVQWVKMEMLKQIKIKGSNHFKGETLDPKLTIDDILLQVSSQQVYQFIRKLPAHKHVAFFYRSKESKDKALTAFFDPAATKDAATGLISLNPIIDSEATSSAGTHKNLNIGKNILYTQIFSNVDKAEIVKRLYRWVYSIHASSGPNMIENGNMNSEKKTLGSKNPQPRITTRVATDDDSWFFANGFGEEILAIEESVGKRMKDNITSMCMYDIPKISDEESLKRLIESHSHVILDYPFVVYAATGEVN
jgi:hypothetical protein